jgi:cellulose synthase/poly-beta-1,6-N-acetylglucosamine synthase-like glycosyltransferase
MSKPYTVTAIGGDFSVFPELSDAISSAKTLGRTFYSLTGGDYDCDQDGYFCCNDGLTDQERELIEESFNSPRDS